MNRQEKELVIESLRNDFLKSQALFLVGVEGLTVSQIQSLRRSLHAQGGKLRVAKNTLAKIVANDVKELCELKPYLKQQVAIVFALKESPAIAKIVWDATKENEKINLVVGCFESRIINKDMIEFLATLPPRPVLLAQLCGTLKAPLARPVGVLHQVLARFLWVLKQASEKNK